MRSRLSPLHIGTLGIFALLLTSLCAALFFRVLPIFSADWKVQMHSGHSTLVRGKLLRTNGDPIGSAPIFVDNSSGSTEGASNPDGTFQIQAGEPSSIVREVALGDKVYRFGEGPLRDSLAGAFLGLEFSQPPGGVLFSAGWGARIRVAFLLALTVWVDIKFIRALRRIFREP